MPAMDAQGGGAAAKIGAAGPGQDGEGASTCSTATGGVEDAEGGLPRFRGPPETRTPPRSARWRPAGSQAVGSEGGRSCTAQAADLSYPSMLRRRLFDREEEVAEASGVLPSPLVESEFGLSFAGNAYTSLVLNSYGQVASFHLQASEDVEGTVSLEVEEEELPDELPESELPEPSSWASPRRRGPEPGSVILIVAGGLRDPVSRLRGRLACWTEEARCLDGPLTFVEANPCGTRPFTQEEVRGCVVIVRGSPEASCLKQVLHAGAGRAAGLLIADDEGDNLCRVPLPIWAERLVVPTVFASLADGLAVAERLVARAGEGLRLAALPVPAPASSPVKPPPLSARAPVSPSRGTPSPTRQLEAAASALAPTSPGAVPAGIATAPASARSPSRQPLGAKTPGTATPVAVLTCEARPVSIPATARGAAAPSIVRLSTAQRPSSVLPAAAVRMQSMPPPPVQHNLGASTIVPGRASPPRCREGASASAAPAASAQGNGAVLAGLATVGGAPMTARPWSAWGLRGRSPAPALHISLPGASLAATGTPPPSGAAPAIARQAARRARCSAPATVTTTVQAPVAFAGVVREAATAAPPPPVAAAGLAAVAREARAGGVLGRVVSAAPAAFVTRRITAGGVAW